MRIFLTGGCGFIGSNFVRFLLNEGHSVVNLDKLTYSGNMKSLEDIEHYEQYFFVQGDIQNNALVHDLILKFKPDIIFNLAAESHVDRSIDAPMDFVHTNVLGTFSLLEAAREYYNLLFAERRASFKFIQVSTDEVFGSLKPNEHGFAETTPYAPSSPYSATKAGADHLVRAYNMTYGLPSIITNCSNNYGPYQFPEKLIPMMIESAFQERSLPVYGDGLNIRDWINVMDHCRALLVVALRGKPGESYNIGGRSERTNLEVVRTICDSMDTLAPRKNGASYNELIAFVPDRPGHDRRYAVDCAKIERELGWQAEIMFEKGILETVRWYLNNRAWLRSIFDGSYKLDRLGRGS